MLNMCKMLVTALLLMIGTQVFAENEKVKIWPKLAPGSENLPNKEVWEENRRVKGVYQPDLTVFPLSKKQKNAPVLLVFPGGGYRQVVIEKEGYKIARWANQNGLASFVLKYRLEPKSALRDAQRAVSFIRTNAKKYGIDSTRIGVIGFSAGAHLAANLSMNYDKRKTLDDVDKASSRPDFLVGVYSGYPDIFGSLGNFKVRDDFPPTFLVHSGGDDRVKAFGSLELYSALYKNKISAELHIYEHGRHGFALEVDRGDATTSTVKAWSRRCIEWLTINGVLK